MSYYFSGFGQWVAMTIGVGITAVGAISWRAGPGGLVYRGLRDGGGDRLSVLAPDSESCPLIFG